MAIDTENKRRSVLASLGLMHSRPNGTITADDRATEAWIYGGLLAPGAVVVTAPRGRVVAALHGGIMLIKQGSA